MVNKWKCKNPLTLSDRKNISQGICLGWSYGMIASDISRCKSVVIREVKRCGQFHLYDAEKAQADFEHKQTLCGKKKNDKN